MTISNEVNRSDYTGNGSVSVYSYGFKIFAKTDLRVTTKDLSSVETTLVVDADYTVAGIGDTAGGSITLLAGNLTSGYLLTIRRLRPLTQETDIRNQGDFFPEIHEDAFDDLVMKDQTQQFDLDRALKVSETTPLSSAVLPPPEALKWPRWNAAGDALENINAGDLGSIATVDASLTLAASELGVALPTRHGTAGGTVDAITCTTSPALGALADRVRVLVKMAGANATTTPTFAPDGLVAKTIVKGSNQALVAGDIPGANFWADVVYNVTLDKWVLLNPAYPVAASVTNTAIRDITRNLIVTVNASNPSYQVDVTADELLLQDSSGVTFRATTVAVTGDITASGENGLDTGAEASSTWYYLWVIYDGSTVAALLSASSTAPTLPSGYTYMALVGAVRNNGSSNFIAFYQEGSHVEYNAVQTILNGTVTTSAWTAQSVTSFFPSTAKRVVCVLTSKSIGSPADVEVGLSPRSDGHAGDYFCAAVSTHSANFGVFPSARYGSATLRTRYAATLYYWMRESSASFLAVGWEY